MQTTKLNYMAIRHVIRSTPYQRNPSSESPDLSACYKKLTDASRRLASAVIVTNEHTQPSSPYPIENPRDNPSGNINIGETECFTDSPELKTPDSTSETHLCITCDPFAGETIKPKTTQSYRNIRQSRVKPWLSIQSR